MWRLWLLLPKQGKDVNLNRNKTVQLRLVDPNSRCNSQVAGLKSGGQKPI